MFPLCGRLANGQTLSQMCFNIIFPVVMHFLCLQKLCGGYLYEGVKHSQFGVVFFFYKTVSSRLSDWLSVLLSWNKTLKNHYPSRGCIVPPSGHGYLKVSGPELKPSGSKIFDSLCLQTRSEFWSLKTNQIANDQIIIVITSPYPVSFTQNVWTHPSLSLSRSLSPSKV